MRGTAAHVGGNGVTSRVSNPIGAWSCSSKARRSERNARPSHELTPAYYGCLDWHCDVHGHWLLVRFLRLCPDAAFAAAARVESYSRISPLVNETPVRARMKAQSACGGSSRHLAEGSSRHESLSSDMLGRPPS
ncbi:MAG: DUF2891 family protein [Steroidobacterales bacterium]